MKLLHIFETLTNITSSGANANFPAANIADLDPMIRFQADAYSGDVWIKIDFGTAKALDSFFLNQANFPHCHIQGNATDSWTTPSLDVGCDLVKDELDNRKGWFEGAFNYRYLRILVPSGQTLDNSEAVPALGNLIVGSHVDLPAVSAYTVGMVKRWDRFEPDGGGLEKNTDDRGRHVVTLESEDDVPTLRAIPKNWEIGVVFTDLGLVAESWLVYPPEEWSRPVKYWNNSLIQWTCEEKP